MALDGVAAAVTAFHYIDREIKSKRRGIKTAVWLGKTPSRYVDRTLNVLSVEKIFGVLTLLFLRRVWSTRIGFPSVFYDYFRFLEVFYRVRRSNDVISFPHAYSV